MYLVSMLDSILTDAAMTECRRLLNEIRSAPLSHPQIASRIHRKAYDILGNADPFAELKDSWEPTGNRSL